MTGANLLVLEVLGLLYGVALVSYLLARQMAAQVRWVAQSMEPRAKRVALGVFVPGLGLAVWLAARGIDSTAALVVGAVASAGLYVIALVGLRMEGTLLETDSQFCFRQEHGIPPPTSGWGRVLAASIGVVLLSTAAFAAWLVW